MKKLLNLLNIKNWISTFVGKLILSKGVKHAVTVVVGLVLGAKVQAILTQFGVSVDMSQFQAELTVLFGGLAGSVINWAQKAMDKDGDGYMD
jgi:hypothetical protein